MVFKTIQKHSAPDLVIQQILRQIRNNTLPPDSRLPSQRDLARILGVGRSSVREAVNTLVAMGHLEPIQGKGTFIRNKWQQEGSSIQSLDQAFRASSFFDLMEARTMLECKSAVLAAQRANPAHLAKIREILKDISDAYKDYSTFLKTDIRFHHALAEATNNAVICELTKLVLEKVQAYHAKLNTGQFSQAYKELSVHSAKKVLEAVEAGDAPSAALWMERHVTAVSTELGRVI